MQVTPPIIFSVISFWWKKIDEIVGHFFAVGYVWASQNVMKLPCMPATSIKQQKSMRSSLDFLSPQRGFLSLQGKRMIEYGPTSPPVETASLLGGFLPWSVHSNLLEEECSIWRWNALTSFILFTCKGISVDKVPLDIPLILKWRIVLDILFVFFNPVYHHQTWGNNNM